MNASDVFIRVPLVSYASVLPIDSLPVAESDDTSVGEEGRASVRHTAATREVEVLEAGAPGGDRPEPAVRHLPAVAEVEVLAVQATGGDRP